MPLPTKLTIYRDVQGNEIPTIPLSDYVEEQGAHPCLWCGRLVLCGGGSDGCDHTDEDIVTPE